MVGFIIPALTNETTHGTALDEVFRRPGMNAAWQEWCSKCFAQRLHYM